MLHAIFTPDILHYFIMEAVLSFKDDVMWLFMCTPFPMIIEFIKTKFPAIFQDDTTKTDSEVDNH